MRIFFFQTPLCFFKRIIMNFWVNVVKNSNLMIDFSLKFKDTKSLYPRTQSVSIFTPFKKLLMTKLLIICLFRNLVTKNLILRISLESNHTNQSFWPLKTIFFYKIICICFINLKSIISNLQFSLLVYP